MRNLVTSLVELAGAVSFTIGCALIYAPAGWISGGVLAILFAVRGAE